MVYQIPKAGIANNAIDQFKLEDGAVTNNKIGDSQITLAKLSGDARRQSVTRLEGSTATLTLTEALSNGNVLVDCSVNAKLILLPASPSSGTWLTISDIKKNSAVNAITIRPDGANSINEGTNGVDYILNSNGASITFVYDAINANWVLSNTDIKDNVFTANANTSIRPGDFCVVTQDNITLTLPASPVSGNIITINMAGTYTNVTVARNGKQIMGLSENLIINIPNTTVTLLYVNDTVQWRII
jgi:hypothetical protein